MNNATSHVLPNTALQHQALFFDLRGLLGLVVLAILSTHPGPVSPKVWLLAIGLLVSDLLFRLLPSWWLRDFKLSYAVFLMDVATLIVILHAINQGRSLLLYLLTIFIAAVGEDVRKSAAFGVAVAGVYVWMRWQQGGTVLGDAAALIGIPLFFVTAVTCGYLAGEVRSLKGKVVKVTGHLTESERLRALAEASESRFRHLVQDVNAIVWEMDPRTFGFTFVSDRAEQVLGYPIEQWTELEFWASHIVPEDRGQVVSASRKCMAEGKEFDIEYRALAADGRVVWLRDLVRVVRDPQQKITQLRGVMFDITGHKRIEETLERLRQENELLLNSAGEGIIGLDLEGKATFVNPAAARMLGWDAKELIGRVQHDVFHHRKSDGTPYPRETCPVYAAFKDGTVHRVVDEVFWQKDGTSFPVEYVSTPILAQDKVAGAVLMFNDITQRTQLESQLRQAQRLEAVGRLAGGVAHDFNNLLTIITGYSQMLLDRLSAGDQARQQVQEIKKAGDRAGALTRQLLAFSRRQVLAPQVLDLNSVVANLEKMLRRLIGEDIELIAHPGPDLGRVRADPSQIEQVIMNLSVNARDAMPDGGQLTIETKNVDLDEAFARNHIPTRPGCYVMLSVSDTGCGMDASTQAHLFEPFFTTKEVGKGTGLGLATVYGIVKQSGGYIWVDTEPGKGARLSVYLPRIEEKAESADAAQPAKTEVPLPKGTETVLLVEDEDRVRSLVREALVANGYTVLEASRPAQALEMCDGHRGPIHLLMTDVVMPGMNGRVLARQLEIKFPLMKVLYMSGYTDDAILHRGIPDAGLPFIQKPFTLAALAHKVREVLDGAPRGLQSA